MFAGLSQCPGECRGVKQNLAQGLTSLLIKPQDVGYRCMILQQEQHYTELPGNLERRGSGH